VLVVHDSSELEFPSMRDGLGRLTGDSRVGFFLHAALAVSADGQRRPLGLLDVRTWTRETERRPRRNGRRLNGAESARLSDRESVRWKGGVERVEDLLGSRARAIHVADREADSYELLDAFVAHEHAFVVRVGHDRRLEDDDAERVSEACVLAPVRVDIEVPLSPSAVRKLPNAARQHAPRSHRVAHLSVSARVVHLKRPGHLKEGQDSLCMHLVHARESDPPEGADPVHWVLYTSEPITTSDDVLRVLEHYRARWLVEEFFKALKTGCTIEKLQLESYEALTAALGIYVPIAYSALALRAAARSNPQAPATYVLTPSQLEVLLLFNHVKLPAAPTVAQALVAVANLGGYIPHKIPPGWLTLARGMEELTKLERGYLAGKAARLMEDH